MDRRRALITGAASGIGRDIAGHLFDRGFDLALVDIDEAGLMDVSSELAARRQSASVHTEVYDLREPDGLVEVVGRASDALGGLDTLVNNAGVRHVAPLEEATVSSWRDEMDVKVTAAFFLTQAVIPHMRRVGRGYIVNVSSISATMGYANRAGYCAANAALLGLTRQNAVELAPAGITVNAVAPGFIVTPLTEYPDDTVRTMERMVPLGRRGTARDVSHAVAFLCSEESSYITGATLSITGGVSDGYVIDAPPWANRYEQSDGEVISGR